VHSRAVRPGPHYRASLDRENVRARSTTSRAIARVIRELADEESLPGPFDSHGLAPVEGDVSVWADARSVPGTGGLWLWYRAVASTLELVAIGRQA
jgi:hypothetical protein